MALLMPLRGDSSTSSLHEPLYVFHYENVLGTSLEIKVAASSASQAGRAEQAVLAEIDRESRILSSWDRAKRVQQVVPHAGRSGAGFSGIV